MKSRPILFSAPMVEALLNGSKTQTRRTWKPRPGKFDDVPDLARCPYGKVGDQLWVKETWRTDCFLDDFAPRDITEDQPIKYECDDEASGIVAFGWGRIRQSIFMRKWMSRITLELTDVRIERLRDISESDAWAEGCYHTGYIPTYNDPDNNAGAPDYRSAKDNYQILWESINGPESWAANPLVWVLQFKRIITTTTNPENQ